MIYSTRATPRYKSCYIPPEYTTRIVINHKLVGSIYVLGCLQPQLISSGSVAASSASAMLCDLPEDTLLNHVAQMNLPVLAVTSSSTTTESAMHATIIGLGSGGSARGCRGSSGSGSCGTNHVATSGTVSIVTVTVTAERVIENTITVTVPVETTVEQTILVPL